MKLTLKKIRPIYPNGNREKDWESCQHYATVQFFRKFSPLFFGSSPPVLSQIPLDNLSLPRGYAVNRIGVSMSTT